MLAASILAVDPAAPGLLGMDEAAAVLTGRAPYRPTPLTRYRPERLPPNERRRMTEVTQLVFRVCDGCMAGQTTEPAASVFASSSGDLNTLDSLSRTLRKNPRAISPTAFHNSVNNASAGYWSIATGSRLPSTTLSAREATFVTGLAEAMATVGLCGQPVLYVAYDIASPALIRPFRPVDVPFATALLLAPPEHAGLGRLALAGKAAPESAETELDECELEALRRDNPAARALPLLRLLALRQAGKITLRGTGTMRWALSLQPCN